MCSFAAQWTRALALLLAALGACGVSRAVAETVSIALPMSEVASYFQIDLGAHPVQVNAIVFSASGSCSAEWQSSGALGEVPVCDDPVAFYPDVTVDLTPDHGVYRVSHVFAEDGVFAVADTVAMELILPNGRSEGYVSFWSTLRAYFLNTCDGPGSSQTCRSCVSGTFVFDRAPVLTIDYSPVVSTERGNWGSIKARYR